MDRLANRFPYHNERFDGALISSCVGNGEQTWLHHEITRYTEAHYPHVQLKVTLDQHATHDSHRVPNLLWRRHTLLSYHPASSPLTSYTR